MDRPGPDTQHDELEQLRDAAAARRERDRQLSMSERLEVVHHLCAQLSELEPVESARHG